MEPICEAKFYEHSYGFRPCRSAENAISYAYGLAQRNKLHYVVDVDVKGFFDNVDHRKLLKQIWTLGIRDTKLIQIIKAMLKAPIEMPDGETVLPSKGTPQGGIPLCGTGQSESVSACGTFWGLTQTITPMKR